MLPAIENPLYMEVWRTENHVWVGGFPLFDCQIVFLRLWLWLGRSIHIYLITFTGSYHGTIGVCPCLSWVIPNAKPQTRQFWITKKDKTDPWMESTHLMFWGWGSIQLELLLILQAMELQNHLIFGMFAQGYERNIVKQKPWCWCLSFCRASHLY